MASLYASYVAERENTQVLESEDGFITYKILENGECYIPDIYVVPEKRKTNVPFKMEKQVVDIAIEHGCHTLVGSVCLMTNNATRNLKILLNDNWELKALSGSMIYVQKSLKGVK